MSKKFCDHDYKNAIKIGAMDYVCPLCKDIVNPFEWFMVNEYDCVFVDLNPKKEDRKTPKRLGKSIVTKKNFLKKPEDKKLLK